MHYCSQLIFSSVTQRMTLEVPSMRDMLEAVVHPFMGPSNVSAMEVQRRLLRHSKLCESCKRIPQLLDGLLFNNQVSLVVHHATPSDLKSAANKGCKICKFLWDACSQRLCGCAARTARCKGTSRVLYVLDFRMATRQGVRTGM